MERKVKVLGQELTIRFNMSVEIIYEELTAKPFNISETIERAKDRMALLSAAIAASNDVPDDFAERLATEASAQEIGELASAVYNAFKEWAKIPEIEADKEPQNQEGETPKN